MRCRSLHSIVYIPLCVRMAYGLTVAQNRAWHSTVYNLSRATQHVGQSSTQVTKQVV